MSIGAKQIESRSWSTSYRGLLAIHQAKGLGPVGGKRGFADQCAGQPFNRVLTKYLSEFDGRPRDVGDSIPLGAVVCVVELVGCHSTNFTQWLLSDGSLMLMPAPGSNEERFGDYSPMRWAWVTKNSRRVWPPIYVPGQQGLRDVPAELEAEIRKRLR